MPFYILLKKWSLANRSLRIIWAPKCPGRKPLSQETVDLIIEIKNNNPNWGGQKISDELAKVGITVCKKTILKYLEIYDLNPPIKRPRPTWQEFIDNHKFKIGVDFTSIFSIFGHQLVIFVLVGLDTRKMVYINVTYNPDFEWVTQQFRNAFTDMDHYPSLCICDNDSIFGPKFENMLSSYFGIMLKRTPYKSPQKNGITERMHLSVKKEAFQNVVPINLRQAQRICSQYQEYYNNYRPHQGINGKIPNKVKNNPNYLTNFIKKKHLGGKITSFEPLLPAFS